VNDAAIWRRLPFGVGDVLVTDRGEEAWLAGASVFSEDAPVAALFRAPSGGADLAVYLRAVEPIDALLLSLSGLERGPIEPPTSIEREGALYARVRRLPVSVTRHGESSFDLEGFAVVGEYRGLGEERLLRVATREAAMTFVGRVLVPGTYDRLPARSE
jgi:hypothetical protein